MSREDDNELDNSGPYKDEKSRLEKSEIKEDHKDSSKSLKTEKYKRDGLSKSTLQDALLTCELLSSLRKFRFSE